MTRTEVRQPQELEPYLGRLLAEAERKYRKRILSPHIDWCLSVVGQAMTKGLELAKPRCGKVVMFGGHVGRGYKYFATQTALSVSWVRWKGYRVGMTAKRVGASKKGPRYPYYLTYRLKRQEKLFLLGVEEPEEELRKRRRERIARMLGRRGIPAPAFIDSLRRSDLLLVPRERRIVILPFSHTVIGTPDGWFRLPCKAGVRRCWRELGISFEEVMRGWNRKLQKKLIALLMEGMVEEVGSEPDLLSSLGRR